MLTQLAESRVEQQRAPREPRLLQEHRRARAARAGRAVARRAKPGHPQVHSEAAEECVLAGAL